LEEREAEQKAEYAKLHERYTDLFKTHMDHMERTKYLLGNDKFDMLHNIPLPNQEQRLKYVHVCDFVSVLPNGVCFGRNRAISSIRS
jgi:hypothetical protein